MNNDLFHLVENTSRNIFLTGKAGTGKTTFLNEFVSKSQKKLVVVAPTGIAAINAGGVTIHSMFGFPLRAFVPTVDRIDGNLAMNIPDLLQHFKYRRDKLKLLREIEIIIIDEVSMLRADLLDMMDLSLRHIRRNQQKFGGVQMLFIGDLYQLPPVVRHENEYILKQYYQSPFFFEAKALENVDLLTVELTEVYRQKDQEFVEILNEIRDGNLSQEHYEKLHSRYLPNFEVEEKSYVYLTSHNRMADEINQRKLSDLKDKSYFFKAKITGDFNEHQYPNEETLELKVGAQIMFIRNDASTEKRYFNGKLAEITAINPEEIWVKIDDDHEEYKLKKEIWEQKRYTLSPEKSIKEEVLGSFEQYPIRLAWAVTIHKSQGLTFDRLMIDAGKSFASGQVYVALSRCRTLDGIVLKSKISPDVIFSDHRISAFQDATNANDQISEILNAEKYDYSLHKMLRKVNCIWIRATVQNWYQSAKESRFVDQEKANNLAITLKSDSKNLGEIFEKFERLVLSKSQKVKDDTTVWKEIEDKVKGAVNFFFTRVHEQIFVPLKDFYAETKGVNGMKLYNDEVRSLLDDIEDYLLDLKTVNLLDTPLFDSANDLDINTKVAKIPAHVQTFQLFQAGKSPAEIAKERGVLLGTIFGHLAKFAEQGILSQEDLLRLVTKEKIDQFRKTYQENPQENLNDWKSALPKEFEYHEIRLLWMYFGKVAD